MEDKYSCNAYDSGYCYLFGRPLTDREDEMCEYTCCCLDEVQSELAEMKWEV